MNIKTVDTNGLLLDCLTEAQFHLGQHNYIKADRAVQQALRIYVNLSKGDE